MLLRLVRAVRPVEEAFAVVKGTFDGDGEAKNPRWGASRHTLRKHLVECYVGEFGKSFELVCGGLAKVAYDAGIHAMLTCVALAAEVVPWPAWPLLIHMALSREELQGYRRGHNHPYLTSFESSMARLQRLLDGDATMSLHLPNWEIADALLKQAGSSLQKELNTRLGKWMGKTTAVDMWDLWTAEAPWGWQGFGFYYSVEEFADAILRSVAMQGSPTSIIRGIPDGGENRTFLLPGESDSHKNVLFGRRRSDGEELISSPSCWARTTTHLSSQERQSWGLRVRVWLFLESVREQISASSGLECPLKPITLALLHCQAATPVSSSSIDDLLIDHCLLAIEAEQQRIIRQNGGLARNTLRVLKKRLQGIQWKTSGRQDQGFSQAFQRQRG